MRRIIEAVWVSYSCFFAMALPTAAYAASKRQMIEGTKTMHAQKINLASRASLCKSNRQSFRSFPNLHDEINDYLRLIVD